MSSTLRHVGLTLSLALLLFGCSQAPTPGPGAAADNPYAGGKSYPWSSRLEAPGADPYAGGKSYPWQSPTAASALGAQGLGEGTTFLSDTTWTSATSAWGRIELDRSNGEQSHGDGRILSIAGVRYAKGLGLHANSEVRYALNRQCTSFSAVVGVDDEVGDRGSVVFQVYGDGVKLFDSGVERGSSPGGDSLFVDVLGVRELRLVVTDSGDNIDYDHADWADAKLSCQTRPPGGSAFLSDLAYRSARSDWGPVELDRSNGEQISNDGQPLSLGGQRFSKGLGVHASSDITYPLGGNCTRFAAQVGVDDEVEGRGSVEFQVYGDGVKLFGSGVVTGHDAARPVDVSVAGVQELRLVVTDGGDNIDYDHADWADARLSCGPTPGVGPGVDPSFGTEGIVTTSLGSQDTVTVEAGAADAQGRIVVVGSAGSTPRTPPSQDQAIRVVRYGPGGTLDSGFGQGGVVTTAFPAAAPATANWSASARDILIDPQGRILVVGIVEDVYSPYTSADFALVRYLPDGRLDPAFGQGGLVRTDVRGSRDTIRSVSLDDQGRILIAGSAGSGSTTQAYTTDFAVARYNPDGTLDPTFGTGGKVVTGFSGGSSEALGLVVDSQGRLLVAGRVRSAQGSSDRLAVARYLVNGSLDPTFGVVGQATGTFAGSAAFIHDAVVDMQGRVVVVGSDSSPQVTNFLIARFGADGTPDSTFGTGGQTTTGFGGTSAVANGVAIDRQGRIAVSGSAYTTVAGRTTGNFAVARLTPNGTLDPAFGQDGRSVTDVGFAAYPYASDWARANDSSSSLVIDAQQRVVALGVTQTPSSPATGYGAPSIALVRHLP